MPNDLDPVLKADGKSMMPGEKARVGPHMVLTVLDLIPDEDGEDNYIRLHDILTEMGTPKEGVLRDNRVKVLGELLNASNNDDNGWAKKVNYRRPDGGQGAQPHGWAIREGYPRENIVAEMQDRIDAHAQAQEAKKNAPEEEKGKDSRARYRGVLVGPMLKGNIRRSGIDPIQWAKDHPDSCSGDWSKISLGNF